MPDSNDITYQTHGVDLVGLLQAISNWVKEFFGFGGDTLSGGSPGIASFFASLGIWWDIYSIIAIALSLLFVWGFIYAKIRLGQLGEMEAHQFHEAEVAWQHTYGGAVTKNNRWHDIEHHVTGDNPNDWRLAIIEADIMLEETLDKAGYVGASIGDKLKTANVNSFTTVQDAWSAHKVRNQIAHSGSDFVLTKRLAQETITKYERVFREFGTL